MASICSFSFSVLHYQNYHNRSRQLKIRQSAYSAQSTSKAITAKAITAAEPLARRSANYAPSLWSFDHIQSLYVEYTGGEDCKARADKLKDTVKNMINELGNPLSTLKLVDDLQRLGISYHFVGEIRNHLEVIYNNYYKTHDKWNTMDLNLKAIGFRLLRQHGFQVPQEIFHNFMDHAQNLNPHSLKDMMGMLNLYEASYLSYEDESILDDAREFTTKYLKENQDKIIDESILSLVSHSLEFPLHWRVPRIEAKWFIKIYNKRSDMNPTLTELAKLDFDMVQALHIDDLKHTSMWWRNTRWDEKLTFARDRLVENFLWTIGYSYLPKFSLGRRNLTKVNAMVTTIDDIYDVYATLDELEVFTNVISRWDINAMETLPDYMKICFLGFYNTINEIAYSTLINTGILILPYLKKAWADLCKAYLVEAKWYHSGYTPTLQEYLDNAYVTISSPLVLMHIKFSTSIDSTEEILEWLEEAKNIIHHAALIFRLADDLGTSSDEMERGDISKSIQCYMHESGATEDEARMHIKNLIMETWKKLNKERSNAKSQNLWEFVDYAMDIVRMAQFMYDKGDGHGCPDLTESHASSLLFNPIQGI